MKNPISWFEIYVNDMHRAKVFYQNILNITLEQLSDPTGGGAEMWAFSSNFEEYGASGALVKMDGFSGGGSSTIVYFSSDDCSIEESKVVEAGGKIVQSKMSIGDYGFCTLIQDTEGNMVGIHSQQ